MSDKRNIAVLIGSSLAWREQVMRGIASYANERGEWRVFTAPEGEEYTVFSAGGYRWDGLIVRPAGAAFARRALNLGVPVVSVGSLTIDPKIPRVKLDDAANTALILRHLIAGGVKRFAYCSFYPSLKIEDRGAAFIANVKAMGFACASFNQAYRVRPGDRWSQRFRQLTKWLRDLPKPCGILCYSPDVACEVVDACNREGIRVPDDIAVVASDDDPMKCELSRPTITAAEIPAARIGYEASALLDRLMRGGQAPTAVVQVPPTGVLAIRQSTAVTNVNDREVQQAAELIRKSSEKRLSVKSLAAQMQVSPRWLQRHFKRVLDASPSERIARAKIETAERLLLETDWSAARIAAKAGFCSPSHLNCAIRQHTGLTPIKLRQKYRLGK